MKKLLKQIIRIKRKTNKLFNEKFSNPVGIKEKNQS